MEDRTELEPYEKPESLFVLEEALVDDWDDDDEKPKGKPPTFWEANGEPIGALIMIVVFFLGMYLFVSWVFSWNDEYEVKVAAIQIALETGEIRYPEAELIKLGTTAYASPGEVTDTFLESKRHMPERMPTRWLISQCQSFRLPDDASGLFVVAPASSANEVQVSLPHYTSGTVNICVTGGHSVEILVWLP